MRPWPDARHAGWAVAWTALIVLAACPAVAGAEGIFEGVTVSEELLYSIFSSKTTDTTTGITTTLDSQTYGSRTRVRVNYDLLPSLNLDAGGTYDKNFFDVSGDAGDTETEITRIRPYIWLNFRDPVFGASLGYDVADETVDTSGLPETGRTRETYTSNLSWRPLDLPWTQFRYTRTSTYDHDRETQDIDQDQLFLRSEYTYGGLNAYYAGTYLKTTDHLEDAESTLLSHEGKVLYSTTFLDGRMTFTTDNRIRLTEVTTDRGLALAGLANTTVLALPAVAGLFATDDTPDNGTLASTPALINGDIVTSAGPNIGFLGFGVPRDPRNIGLDFGTPLAVNTLRVWVTFPTDPLPGDIVAAFSWDVYTSSDNVTWTLHATVGAASFAVFDRRFDLAFPSVTTRYIKAVTRPLPPGVVGTTPTSDFPNILVTEIQAFADTLVAGAAGAGRLRTTQTVRSHNVDFKAILFRLPLLYYRFTGDYLEIDTEDEPRYNISNGLFLSHRLNRYLSTNANAAYEFGRERGESRRAILYYGALTATPLRTLTDSLVFSGNRQWIGDTTTTTDSLVLYNTAQLYRGIDATLNLGAVFASDELDVDASQRRREYYVNIGTGIVPHPNLTLATYYVGRLIHSSTRQAGTTRDTDSTEHRLDWSVYFTPFRTLALSATTNIVSRTDEDLSVTQNYAVSWAPFPDGNLQFSFIYSEDRFPDESTSRIVQPSVRWYLTSRRRSFLEATYQHGTTDAPSLESETRLFSTRLNVYY
jgi:hypothetical protein